MNIDQIELMLHRVKEGSVSVLDATAEVSRQLNAAWQNGAIWSFEESENAVADRRRRAFSSPYSSDQCGNVGTPMTAGNTSR